MYCKPHIIYTIFICAACNNNAQPTSKNVHPVTGNRNRSDTNHYRNMNEIPLPHGFTRISRNQNSFGSWLLNVRLKKDKTVYLFNGLPKRNQAAQFAVLDISVGDQDLQQCADAVMRLRAEYLFTLNKFQDIQFVDNAGTVYQ